MTCKRHDVGFPIMDRRDFLKTTTAAAFATGARTPLSGAATAQPDLIKAENAKPGASFQLTRMRPDDAKSYRTSLIEGYCSRQSVKAGEKLDIFVSTKPVAKFTIEIFRMGYYDGAGSRLMTTLGPFEGKTQPVPEMADRRLRECQWEASTTLTIPDECELNRQTSNGSVMEAVSLLSFSWCG